MTPRFLACTCIGLLMFTTSAAAQQRDATRQSTAELALSDDTLQLRYFDARDPAGVGGRLSGTFFLSEERDIVLSGAWMLPADIDVGIGELSILIGPQAYAALLEDENSDVMSVALGTELRLLLNRRLGLAVAGRAFYGPDIMTFGAADSLTDLSARVEMNVAPRVTAFGGMRWFEFDLTEGRGERTLQEELFVGVGYRF